MSCDLQADLVGCVDAARQIVDDFGLRVEVVEVITVQWSGIPGVGLPNDYEYGLGTSTQVSRVALTPKPLVSSPRPRLVAANPGRYLEGDRIISKLSRTYLKADLTLPPDAGGGEKLERYFLIDGLPYRQINELEKLSFEWIIHVRRMRDRPAINVIP